MQNLFIAKLDYLAFCTNIIDANIEADLRTTPAKPIADRFYKFEYDTPNYLVRTGKKNRNLRSASVRVQHEMLPFVLHTGLPKDYNLTRLDVAVDCKTKDQAMSYVTLQYSSQVHSYSNGDFGETWYFGDRHNPLFERVYWKIELQVWRYELEIKPQNRPLPKKKWVEINPEVRQVYSDVNRCFVNPGMDISEVLAAGISKARQQELIFLLECKYLSYAGRCDAWQDMDLVEKDFCEKYLFRHKPADKEQRFDDWQKLTSLYFS